MAGFIILILLVVALPYVYRWLRPYIYRWMQRRAENYVRRAMGMPPRGKDASDKERRSQSRSQRQEETRGRSRGARAGSGSGYGRRAYASADEPLIPKEYAEDVAFTEIHSYSEDTVIGEEGGHVRVKVESQVSDAEIIEIKKNR